MSGKIGRTLAGALRQVLQYLGRGEGSKRTPPRAGRSRPRPGHSGTVAFPFDSATVAAPSKHAAREYRMPSTGLPRLEYTPQKDGEADPGEVVWAWVPYEDDANKGKDRPVLIISEVPGGYLGLQMTSKNHTRDRAREERYGRHWLDLGSGPWDAQRRDSEVRLDRLLFIPPRGIRREGATLPLERYLEVVQALQQLHP